MLIKRDRSCLVLVDVQEKLLPTIHGGAAMVERCAFLLKTARRLEVPILASEQYPRGLGGTVEALRPLVPEDGFVSKVDFPCTGEPDFSLKFSGLGREQVVLCGIEAHVCVLQTAFGLAAEGYKPFVVADAVASRDDRDRRLATARLRAAGIGVVSAEMVFFEWLGKAGTPEFKELQGLLK